MCDDDDGNDDDDNGDDDDDIYRSFHFISRQIRVLSRLLKTENCTVAGADCVLFVYKEYVLY